MTTSFVCSSYEWTYHLHDTRPENVVISELSKLWQPYPCRSSRYTWITLRDIERVVIKSSHMISASLDASCPMTHLYAVCIITQTKSHRWILLNVIITWNCTPESISLSSPLKTSNQANILAPLSVLYVRSHTMILLYYDSGSVVYWTVLIVARLDWASTEKSINVT